MNDGFEKSISLFDSAKRALEPSPEEVDRNYRETLVKLAAFGTVAASPGAEIASTAGASAPIAPGATATAGAGVGKVASAPGALLAAKWIAAVALTLGVAFSMDPFVRSDSSERRMFEPSSKRAPKIYERVHDAIDATMRAASDARPASGDDARGEIRDGSLVSSSDVATFKGDPSKRGGRDLQRPISVGEPPMVAPVVDGSLAPELALVKKMERAQRSGKNQEALVLIAEHEKTFPKGVFREEREAIRALAICAADEAARSSALIKFESAFPSSSMRERVRKACLP